MSASADHGRDVTDREPIIGGGGAYSSSTLATVTGSPPSRRLRAIDEPRWPKPTTQTACPSSARAIGVGRACRRSGSSFAALDALHGASLSRLTLGGRGFAGAIRRAATPSPVTTVARPLRTPAASSATELRSSPKPMMSRARSTKSIIDWRAGRCTVSVASAGTSATRPSRSSSAAP